MEDSYTQVSPMIMLSRVSSGHLMENSLLSGPLKCSDFVTKVGGVTVFISQTVAHFLSFLGVMMELSVLERVVTAQLSLDILLIGNSLGLILKLNLMRIIRLQ